ncbi:MAG: type IV toxin-antitoxin system AbiEi family antitoxin domain-containing protein, partial [Nitrospinota bacterium]
MKRLAKESFQRLYEIIEAQQGFFTTKQAIAAGYVEKTHSYHVRVGNWIREYRGIYRLVNFPSSEEADLVLWSLWSRNRQDVTQGVYSHETALSIHDLSDLMPSKLHMTVPKSFRRNSKIPEVLILHRAHFKENDIESRQGFRVTT